MECCRGRSSSLTSASGTLVTVAANNPEGRSGGPPGRANNRTLQVRGGQGSNAGHSYRRDRRKGVQACVDPVRGCRPRGVPGREAYPRGRPLSRSPCEQRSRRKIGLPLARAAARGQETQRTFRRSRTLVQPKSCAWRTLHNGPTIRLLPRARRGFTARSVARIPAHGAPVALSALERTRHGAVIVRGATDGRRVTSIASGGAIQSDLSGVR
jgi:hypothetical protein